MRHKRILTISLLGNVLEYFDFTIFAVFSVQIGKAFFPGYDDFTQTLWSLSIFGAGFITRPFGSVLFGHLGDKKGRKKTLIYTITGMAFTTLFMGLMPAYDEIGIIAPILLCVLRLAQGLFVGGESAGAAVYILEQNKVYDKGIIGSFIMSSNIFGATTAMITGLIINYFTNEDIAWRILFFTGGIFGLVIIFLRKTLPETVEYMMIRKNDKIINFPLIKLIKTYWRQVATSFMIGAFTSSVSYCTKAYLNVHFQQVMMYSIITSLQFSIYTLFFFMLLLPLFGYISNRIGFQKFMIIYSIVVIILIPIGFILISYDDIYKIIAGLTIIGALAAGICAPIYPYMANMFPANVRYTGVAVSYNLGVTFFGGFSPLILTLISNWTQIKSSAFVYIIILGIVYLLLELSINKKPFKYVQK
jgi:MHS family proline/betaine transporter-like MFS transporter